VLDELGLYLYIIVDNIPYQRFNASTLQRFNASTLQRFNASTLQRFNASMLQCFNASMLQCFNASMLQCYLLLIKLVGFNPMIMEQNGK
jgi:hypothetical protein